MSTELLYAVSKLGLCNKIIFSGISFPEIAFPGLNTAIKYRYCFDYRENCPKLDRGSPNFASQNISTL